MTDAFPLPEGLRGVMPFSDLVGIQIVSYGTESVVAQLEWSPERCTSGDVLHGGAVMSLADSAGGLLAFANLPEGAAGTTTLSSSTQFLRGLRSGTATATARLLHRGRTTIVVETDVLDDSGRMLARVTQTQAVLTA